MAKRSKFTKQDLEFFEKRLLVLRERIVTGLENIQKNFLNKSQRDATGDLSGYSFHMADVATNNFDTEFQLGMASTEQQLLNEIDMALKKIKDGAYGMCEKYGTSISKERLKVMPHARYCVKAQEEMERK